MVMAAGKGRPQQAKAGPSRQQAAGSRPRGAHPATTCTADSSCLYLDPARSIWPVAWSHARALPSWQPATMTARGAPMNQEAKARLVTLRASSGSRAALFGGRARASAWAAWAAVAVRGQWVRHTCPAAPSPHLWLWGPSVRTTVPDAASSSTTAWCPA